MPGFLFDSYALLAFFQNENGAETVLKFIEESKENRLEPLICAINLGEILSLTKRRFGHAKKIEILGRIHQLAFSIIPATNQLVFEAAEIKADHPVSYADSFAVAGAIDQSAEIVTGDPDFKKVEHLVKIHWIQSKSMQLFLPDA
jgi:ribonuclease VapC